MRKTIGAAGLAVVATVGLGVVGSASASATDGSSSSLTCSRFINNKGEAAISCTATSAGDLHFIKGVDAHFPGLSFSASAKCAYPQDGLFHEATAGTSDINPNTTFRVSVGICGGPTDIYRVDAAGNVTFVRSN